MVAENPRSLLATVEIGNAPRARPTHPGHGTVGRPLALPLPFRKTPTALVGRPTQGFSDATWARASQLRSIAMAILANGKGRPLVGIEGVFHGRKEYTHEKGESSTTAPIVPVPSHWSLQNGCPLEGRIVTAVPAAFETQPRISPASYLVFCRILRRACPFTRPLLCSPPHDTELPTSAPPAAPTTKLPRPPPSRAHSEYPWPFPPSTPPPAESRLGKCLALFQSPGGNVVMSKTAEELFREYEGEIVPRAVHGGFVALSYAVSWIGALSTLELINRRTSRRGLFN